MSWPLRNPTKGLVSHRQCRRVVGRSNLATKVIVILMQKSEARWFLLFAGESKSRAAVSRAPVERRAGWSRSGWPLADVFSGAQSLARSDVLPCMPLFRFPRKHVCLARLRRLHDTPTNLTPSACTHRSSLEASITTAIVLFPHIIRRMAFSAARPSLVPQEELESFQQYLAKSTRILALLGAGLSASSGLPTFRGAGGLWRTHDATSLATPEAFERDPALVWQFYSYRRHMALKAKPNTAHYALAELARKKDEFITLSQNVDGS